MRRRQALKSVGAGLTITSGLLGLSGSAAASQNWIQCTVTEQNGVRTKFQMSLDGGSFLDYPDDWEAEDGTLIGTLDGESETFAMQAGYGGGLMQRMGFDDTGSRGSASVSFDPAYADSCVSGFTGSGEVSVREEAGNRAKYQLRTNAGIAEKPVVAPHDGDSGDSAAGVVKGGRDDYQTRGYIDHVAVGLNSSTVTLLREQFDPTDCDRLIG